MNAADTPVWDDGRWPPLPSLDGAVDADVCVVGLGGSGLACVLELRRRGATVVGLEAASVAGGAAGRNGGFLLAGTTKFYHEAVRSLGRDRARTIYRLTMRELDRMHAESPELIRRVGSLRIADSPDELEDCVAQGEAMAHDGLPVEPYDGPEGLGLYLPTDGAFQPLARCRLLAQRAMDAGARLFEHSRALSVAPGAVTTRDGTVRCRSVVVAVDGGLGALIPELADQVRSARLQMLATAPAPDLGLRCPVYARWGHDFWQQLPDGRVALGGARDLGGDAEWSTYPVPSPAVQGVLERILRERLDVQAPITHRWAAIVGYTSDLMPIVEEVRPGLWAVGAYSGTGNVIGSLLGRAVAEAVVEGASPVVDVFRA